MEPIDILANYLKENTSFSSHEVEIVCSFFQPERLSKEEILFASGNLYSKIVYVAEGILRSFIYNDNGEEIVKTFISENDFIAEINSFENDTPAAFNVAAITPCQVLTLSKTDSEKLIGHLPKWEMAAKEGMTKAMNLMIRKQEFLYMGDAIDKYKYFVQNYPGLALRLPLKYISSYLQITQSSLSRIRKQLW